MHLSLYSCDIPFIWLFKTWSESLPDFQALINVVKSFDKYSRTQCLTAQPLDCARQLHEIDAHCIGQASDDSCQARRSILDCNNWV